VPLNGRTQGAFFVILGIGFDLVDVVRFARVRARHDPGFVASLFPPAEIAWCAGRPRRDEHLAARFAAREALLKALGTGLVGLMSWRDIEVIAGDVPGVVSLAVRGAVAAEAERQGVRRIHLALATTRSIAAATVIVEGDGAASVPPNLRGDCMKDVILEYIKHEYVDEDEADEIKLDEHTPLISSGIVDSFSMVSLKRFLEKKYAISIPDEQATPEAFNTVASIIQLVEKCRK
jgi:holo-[acyl-carrier protein] synthase